MLQLPNPKALFENAILKRVRRANKVNLNINTKSHVQKKYLSLMLVPSYTSGKTRSIRIPYMAFYMLFFTLLAIAAVVLFFYAQAEISMRREASVRAYLEQYQEAYVSLQEITEEEQRRLTEENINMRSALTQQQIRGREEQHQQRLTYLETLEAIQAYIEGLELQLEQFEIYRQEIMEHLSSNAHIPPVRNMLNEMHQSQVHLLAALQDLSEYSELRRQRANEQNSSIMLMSSLTTAEDAAMELFDYIAVVELTLETKAELYSQLNYHVRLMSRYIRNYPTTRPVNGRLTSGFGWRRNPWGGSGSQMHTGVDIAAPTGTAIRATGGGTVIFSGWHTGGYGNKVIIDHGMGIQTVYAHNSSNLVTVGQQVNRGDTIARVGSTGRSTGPHVHYEVLVNGTAVNPNQFFLR